MSAEVPDWPCTATGRRLDDETLRSSRGRNLRGDAAVGGSPTHDQGLCGVEAMSRPRKTGQPHRGWKAAARATRCRHRYETLQQTIRGGMIVADTCRCVNCGVIRETRNVERPIGPHVEA